jgi:hypothetical protein
MERIPTKKSIAAELQELYKADQNDRESDSRQTMGASDALRLNRAREIYNDLQEGKIELSENDIFNLGLLFHHSRDVEDYRIAHELGLRAGEKGKWLSAVAEDRYLLAKGEKQKWGTQFTKETGEWQLSPMQDDAESGITDEMREIQGIPIRSDQIGTHIRNIGEEK